MHVALNVPEADEPLICVTTQLKLTQESASEPVDPGSDCVVAHVPLSDCADVVVVVLALGLVRLLKTSQAVTPVNAAMNTASSKARRIFLSRGDGRPTSRASLPTYNYRPMAILKVARMGHPVLRAKALPVTPSQIRSAPVQRLIDDMFETMREYTGIGLAAPQVHQSVRLFVAGVRKPVENEPLVALNDDENMPLIVVINPEITAIGETIEDGWEGCLSIPDIRGLVPRATDIKVSAYDRTGERVTFTASGLPVFVHERERH